MYVMDGKGEPEAKMTCGEGKRFEKTDGSSALLLLVLVLVAVCACDKHSISVCVCVYVYMYLALGVLHRLFECALALGSRVGERKDDGALVVRRHGRQHLGWSVRRRKVRVR